MKRVPSLDQIESILTMGEALAAGFIVTELAIGDEVIRAYGRTAADAKARLRVKLARRTTLRTPAEPWGVPAMRGK